MVTISAEGNIHEACDNTTLNCYSNVSGIDANLEKHYVWMRDNTVVIGQQSSPMLSSLRIDESGSYTCTMTINDTLLSSPITVVGEVYNITILRKCSVYRMN